MLEINGFLLYEQLRMTILLGACNVQLNKCSIENLCKRNHFIKSTRTFEKNVLTDVVFVLYIHNYLIYKCITSTVIFTLFYSFRLLFYFILHVYTTKNGVRACVCVCVCVFLRSMEFVICLI